MRINESSLAALVLIGTILSPVAAKGQQDYGQIRIRNTEIDGIVWKYSVQRDSAVIMSGNEHVPVISPTTTGKVVVPSEIDGFPVQRIESFAFEGCHGLTEVEFRPGRMSLGVGMGLFTGCRSLRRVVFPERFFQFIFVSYNSGNGPQMFDGCRALKEVVFLGEVPQNNFMGSIGISLNHRLRYTERYRKQWEAFAEDHEIIGARIYRESDDEASGIDDAGMAAGGDASEGSETEEKDASGVEPVLELDVSSLVEAYGNAGISNYKCRAALNEFKKAVAEANSEAAAKREETLEKTRQYLHTAMEKAQTAGDLDAVIALKEALDTVDGGLAGDATEIARLRKGRDAQFAKIGNVLAQSGLNAAKALHSVLVAQKKELTQKGEIEMAQKINDFQQKVEEWAEEVRTAQAAANRMSPQALQGADRQSRPAGSKAPAARIVSIDAKNGNGEFACSAKKGDRIEIRYVDGMWTPFSNDQTQSPDDRVITSLQKGRVPRNYRCILVNGNDPATVCREIPPGTKETPFVFDVVKTGTFALRANDGPPGKHYNDNVGVVRYSIRVIPSEGTAAYMQPANERQATRQVTAIKAKAMKTNVYLDCKLMQSSSTLDKTWKSSYSSSYQGTKTKSKTYLATVRNPTGQEQKYTLEWFFIGRKDGARDDFVLDEGSKAIVVAAGGSEEVTMSSKSFEGSVERFSGSTSSRGVVSMRGIVVQLFDQNGEIVRVFTSQPSWQDRAWIVPFAL